MRATNQLRRMEARKGKEEDRIYHKFKFKKIVIKTTNLNQNQ